MSNPVANKASMIRTYRKFPEDTKSLVTELTRGWEETANALNNRVIGFFTDAPTLTGKQYFFNGKRFDSLQQIYYFDDSTLTIAHNIKGFSQIVGQYGWFTDNTNWYPLPFVSQIPAQEVAINADNTYIYINKGGAVPAITSGYAVLEWLQGS